MDVKDEKIRDQILLILFQLSEAKTDKCISDTEIGHLYRSGNSFSDKSFYTDLGQLYLEFVKEGLIEDETIPSVPKSYKFKFTEIGERKINEILKRSEK